MYSLLCRRAAPYLLTLVALCQPGPLRADQSELWGAAGEKWMPGGPLKDFSLAGYKKNDAPIPDFPVGVNVKNFGALGDGAADDTAAFVKAVAACPANAAVYVPDGTYVIKDRVRIAKNDLVLRGQSPDKTILFFPTGLQVLYPDMGVSTTGAAVSNWSWSGGLIWFDHVGNAGIEGLTLKFPEVPYPGHFKESGLNGVNFSKCKDCWARDLTFVNADSGIYAAYCGQLTFRHLTFDAYPGRPLKGMSGHHGVDFSSSAYCLLDGATFHVRFFHELGIEHGAYMNVYMNASGPSLHLDHHQTDSHDNLWTNIDTGDGASVWQNNAHTLWPSRAGSTDNETYWNIRATKGLVLPETKYHNVIVGMSTDEPAVKRTDGAWYENVDPVKLEPGNLFEAQLAWRRKKEAAGK